MSQKIHNSFFSWPKLQRSIFTPVLTPVLETRSVGIAVAAAACIHTGLVMSGLPSWQCPFLYTIGVPCPGCGLSRAISSLFRGEFQISLEYHALAPFFLIGLLIVGVITFLPNQWRLGALVYLEKAEHQTGVVAIFLITLVGYWLARLIILRSVFINLMLG